MTGSRDSPADDRSRVLKTYRYLRLSMVVLVAMLITAVVAESVRSGRVLDSISAYYFTPARDVFVATLVAIGAGLVALQGRTRAADAALNLAGMLAPVIAFVPTVQGRPPDVTQASLDPGIDTGLLALLVGAVLAFGLLALLSPHAPPGAGRRRDRLGVLAGVAVVVAGVVWYAASRASFVAAAHDVAAGGMFAMIGVDVLVNSRSGPHRRLYATILGLMLLTQVTWLSVPFWDHAVLVVEAALLTLFAVFWLVQTWELSGPDG